MLPSGWGFTLGRVPGGCRQLGRRHQPGVHLRADELNGAKELLATRRYTDAAKVLEVLVTAHPQDGSLYLLLAQSHEGEKDFAAAIRAYTQAKLYLPQSTLVSLALARDLHDSGIGTAMPTGRPRQR